MSTDLFIEYIHISIDNRLNSVTNITDDYSINVFAIMNLYRTKNVVFIYRGQELKIPKNTVSDIEVDWKINDKYYTVTYNYLQYELIFNNSKKNNSESSGGEYVKLECNLLNTDHYFNSAVSNKACSITNGEKDYQTAINLIEQLNENKNNNINLNIKFKMGGYTLKYIGLSAPINLNTSNIYFFNYFSDFDIFSVCIYSSSNNASSPIFYITYNKTATI